MSKLQLGSITANQTGRSPDLYVASIVNSESGPLRPTFIEDTSLIDAYLGNYKYKGMLSQFINDGIPVLVNPLITPVSEYNRSSVRINDSKSSIQHCHPRYDTVYEKLTPSDDVSVTQVELSEQIFNSIIDLSKVSDEQYLQLAGPNNIPLYFILLINGERYLVIRYGEDYAQEVPSNYYDHRVPLSADETNTKDSYYRVLHEQLASILGEGNVLNFAQECCNVVERAFSSTTTDRADFLEWFVDMLDQVYKQEVLLGSYRLLVNKLQEYLVVNGEDSGLDLSQILNTIRTDSDFINYKLMIKYPEVSRDLNHYNFPGAIINSSFSYNQDVLCRMSSGYQVLDIYSKIKGPAGVGTKVTIHQDGRHPNYYDVKVVQGSVEENFYCYIGTNVDDLDAINIRELGSESDLIEVILYDYRLPSGQLIDQLDDIIVDYDPDNVIHQVIPDGEYTLLRTCDEWWIYEDYRNALSYLATLKYYPDLFLVPELIRYDSSADGVNHIVEHIEDLKSYVRASQVMGSGLCEQGKYTQALITVEGSDLEYDNYHLTSEDNRLLFCYSDSELDGIIMPCFYYYADNLLNNSPINIPSDRLIYDIESCTPGNYVSYLGKVYLIKEVVDDQLLLESSIESIVIPKYSVNSIINELDSRDINYLKFNNLYYYYEGIDEDQRQLSTFYIQYHASKIAREVFKIGDQLLASNEYDRLRLLNNCSEKLLRTLPHLQYVNITCNPNGRELSISINARMRSLTNKLYKLDYILNLS